MRPELRDAFEAGWARNEPAYRHLDGPRLEDRLTDHLRRLAPELAVWLLVFAAPLAVVYLLGSEPWRAATESLADLADWLNP